jgi:hypothetical protein
MSRGSLRQFYGAQLQEPEHAGCPVFLANSLTAWAQARFARQQNRRYEPLIEPIDDDALANGEAELLFRNGAYDGAGPWILNRCSEFTDAVNPQPGKAYEVEGCLCGVMEQDRWDRHWEDTYSDLVQPAFARAVCAALGKNPLCISFDQTLALCMSQHCRLGQGSNMSSISSDLLRRIVTEFIVNFDSGQSGPFCQLLWSDVYMSS